MINKKYRKFSIKKSLVDYFKDIYFNGSSQLRQKMIFTGEYIESDLSNNLNGFNKDFIDGVLFTLSLIKKSEEDSIAKMPFFRIAFINGEDKCQELFKEYGGCIYTLSAIANRIIFFWRTDNKLGSFYNYLDKIYNNISSQDKLDIAKDINNIINEKDNIERINDILRLYDPEVLVKNIPVLYDHIYIPVTSVIEQFYLFEAGYKVILTEEDHKKLRGNIKENKTRKRIIS